MSTRTVDRNKNNKYPFRNFNMFNRDPRTELALVISLLVSKSSLVALINHNRHLISESISQFGKLTEVGTKNHDITFLGVAALPE
jgi:hypothetical protein